MENMPKKFIDFIITQNCTYKCAYCSQSKLYNNCKKEADSKTINCFIDFLKTLDKDFEITITGGEALLHKDFFSLIKTIKKMGFQINLISNFSFAIEKYFEIFKLLDDNLNIFDLSFHLDEVKDFKNTLLKLEEFLKNKPKTTKTTLFVPIYNLNNEKEEKINSLIKIAKKYDTNYSFQKIRTLNNYNKTTKNEEKYFENFKPTNSFSKLCLAGSLSAVIYEDGNAYRCYSSRFLKSNYLGNIKSKNFKLKTCAQPCIMKNCTCPKPKAYNQICKNKNLAKANCLKFINYLFMPFYIIKNRKIIAIKLKQVLKNRFN